MAEPLVRLERDTPWRTQVGCSFALGLVLLVVAGGITVPVITHWQGGTQEDWVPALFAAVFGGIGLLMWLTTVHQRLAMRTPETEVWIERTGLRAGERVALRVRQPGPVALKSLRGRLLCEVQVWRPAARSSGSGSWTSKYPYDERFFDLEGAALGAGDALDRTVELTVPADARLSEESPGLRVRWRIEVWGRVRHWPDFMHPFPLKVIG
jgi:hypothetical protein